MITGMMTRGAGPSYLSSEVALDEGGTEDQLIGALLPDVRHIGGVPDSQAVEGRSAALFHGNGGLFQDGRDNLRQARI